MVIVSMHECHEKVRKDRPGDFLAALRTCIFSCRLMMARLRFSANQALMRVSSFEEEYDDDDEEAQARFLL